MEPTLLSPSDLKNALAKNPKPRLIDVRTPAEFHEVHVRGAENIPLDRLDAEQLIRQLPAGHTLHVICKSGSRGGMACKKLLSAGAQNVVNIEGGTAACVDAGLDVVRGKAVMSLERQVRIAAGSLVLLGVGLGVAVHPYGLGLAAFVGAGLVFAGVTDTCGMGMVLARMPWNQAGAAGPAAPPQKQNAV